MDKSDEEYRKLENEIRTSNIVYILLHGGVSSFKKFINLKKTFWGSIPFFINTTIDDENREFVEQGGMPAATAVSYTHLHVV